jgi:L-fuculose-phosphate aldolase
MYMLGFVAANDGNISVRISESEFLCTPTGVSKGFMSTDDIIKVDINGNKISGNLKPSSEIKMHLEVYKNRPDAVAVCHAHPPTATGFAVAGLPLNKNVLPEVIISLGEIPIAQYGTPSTMEIPASISPYLQTHDAYLLANHGALTVGTDVFNAFYKMETMEHFAKISVVSRMLGNENEIPKQEVKKLFEVREKLGVKGRHPSCMNCGACDAAAASENNTASTPTGTEGALSEKELADLVANVTKSVLSQLSRA